MILKEVQIYKVTNVSIYLYIYRYICIYTYIEIYTYVYIYRYKQGIQKMCMVSALGMLHIVTPNFQSQTLK